MNFNQNRTNGDFRGWPGVARATPEISLATPVATPDPIGSWSSSSTHVKLSINGDGRLTDLGSV